MTPDQISNATEPAGCAGTGNLGWLKEIAYQLAVYNERNDPDRGSGYARFGDTTARFDAIWNDLKRSAEAHEGVDHVTAQYVPQVLFNREIAAWSVRWGIRLHDVRLFESRAAAQCYLEERTAKDGTFVTDDKVIERLRDTVVIIDRQVMAQRERCDNFDRANARLSSDLRDAYRQIEDLKAFLKIVSQAPEVWPQITPNGRGDWELQLGPTTEVRTFPNQMEARTYILKMAQAINDYVPPVKS